jgi:hypothetical protein
MTRAKVSKGKSGSHSGYLHVDTDVAQAVDQRTAVECHHGVVGDHRHLAAAEQLGDTGELVGDGTGHVHAVGLAALRAGDDSVVAVSG